MAVNKLKQISQSIMEDHPNLLGNPIRQLVKLMADDKNIEDYDQFTKIVKPLYEISVQKAGQPNTEKMSGSSGVAMVLYVVREALSQSNLNDTHIEMLIEHSIKFLTENAVDIV